jgi:TonB family protein
MTHLFVLWLALSAAQAPTPVTQPTAPATDQAAPAVQPAQPPAPTAPTPDQTAPTEPPSPNPDASGIYQAGDGVTLPKPIHRVDPVIPKEVTKQKISGAATVALIVDTQGNAVNVHIAKSIADSVDEKLRATALILDQAAIDAVKKYRFAPATYNGKPVPVYLNVMINFEIF